MDIFRLSSAIPIYILRIIPCGYIKSYSFRKPSSMSEFGVKVAQHKAD